MDPAGGGQSTSKSTCEVPAWTLTAAIWRSICIQDVQIEAGLNADPGNDSFWDKSVTLSMLIDLLTCTCRSTQVKIASTDLWPQGMFTFSEMLALVESESSFGAYVCHRRPGGSLATSDLVDKYDKKNRTKMRALRDTTGDSLVLRQSRTDANRSLTFRKYQRSGVLQTARSCMYW